jgi:hypothetical protein
MALRERAGNVLGGEWPQENGPEETISPAL